jgi:hypothetical protein
LGKGREGEDWEGGVVVRLGVGKRAEKTGWEEGVGGGVWWRERALAERHVFWLFYDQIY